MIVPIYDDFLETTAQPGLKRKTRKAKTPVLPKAVATEGSLVLHGAKQAFLLRLCSVKPE
ncbi:MULTISPECIES: hypothetical protein [Flavobacterium]|uniref:Uncharacterized protein n=1 Tax=Flavobacterium aurantiibacter TaxID=2023067 RepID=A0A255ZZ73_9FLAO|nr:hypothetical protein [Flavobacterium aurantiibacter]OYQ46847.1 hypothetical protein CHX27_03865 [Flavobacterium aurantiibacter]